jgi:ubiquinone/menaquinone biosynthesis C-methylase UbiE
MQKYGATMAALASLSTLRAFILTCQTCGPRMAAPAWLTSGADERSRHPERNGKAMPDRATSAWDDRCFQRSGHAWRTAGKSFVFQATEYRRISQLLEVGGGSGLLASLIKQYHSHLKITVFDLTEQCDAALDLFREKSQCSDLGAHAGNYREDPFPSGFEAIQFSRILDSLEETQVMQLLVKAFRALPKGGKLLVYARLAASRSPDIARHRVDDYVDWLDRAGFQEPTCRNCPGNHVLLTAVRRDQWTSSSG